MKTITAREAEKLRRTSEMTPEERKAAVEHAARLMENAPRIGEAGRSGRDEMHEP
jgi:hypothetical protein